MLDEFFASFIKESVGRGYATDSQEKAKWNSLFSVVRVAYSFDEVLVLVCGFCVDICLDVKVAKVDLDI